MPIKVVALILDESELIMYTDDGSTVTIRQDDSRLRPIVDMAAPAIRAHGFAMVEIGEPDRGNFAEYEKKSSGLVRFFKVAKDKLKGIFSDAKLEPLSVGSIPNSIPVMTQAESDKAVVDEIIRHAQPTSHPDFQIPTPMEKDEKNTNEHTVVAVVGNQVIPDVHKIHNQVIHALKNPKNQKGLDNFMRRVATVKRPHSVQDLMRFMERGDLPIADDGSIIIYKVLNRHQDEGYYQDCHTGKVKQRVGSIVCVSPELVDLNRDRECSNGLHVARRAYIQGFGGDVCVIAKLNPEDVMAVPRGDANKMRVSAYTILFELRDQDFQALEANRPFTTDDEAQILLGRALAGDYPPPVERVEITKQRGGGLKITPLTQLAQKAAKAPAEPKVVEKAEALPEVTPENATAAPKVAVASVASAVADKAPEAPKSRKDQALDLMKLFRRTKPGTKAEHEASVNLVTFKKKAKVSWSVLGITERDAEAVIKATNNTK